MVSAISSKVANSGQNAVIQPAGLEPLLSENCEGFTKKLEASIFSQLPIQAPVFSLMSCLKVYKLEKY